VDVDQIIRNTANGTNLKVSLISQGEHIERPGLIVSEAIKQQPSPSRIAGSGPTHRFRASGWTRHYETYAEIIQILAQLAFGLALANFKNHGLNLRAKLALAATALLALGITLTAMRTTMIALAIGLCVIGWRSLGRRTGLIAVAAVFSFLVMGAVVVYQTRAQRALFLQDPSSNLRLQVAKVGLSRMLIHPVFGHGMDSMHTHWTAWGFPGSDMLHLHSTPLQLAFDRGLPALGLWLWIMGLFWRAASRGERSSRESGDTNQHGLLLGSTGAVTGFFMSSLVNYNFGDGEVALVFWWLLGIVVVMTIDVSSRQNNHRRHSTLL
jgi:O-antigen ligase